MILHVVLELYISRARQPPTRRYKARCQTRAGVSRSTNPPKTGTTPGGEGQQITSSPPKSFLPRGPRGEAQIRAIGSHGKRVQDVRGHVLCDGAPPRDWADRGGGGADGLPGLQIGASVFVVGSIVHPCSGEFRRPASQLPRRCLRLDRTGVGLGEARLTRTTGACGLRWRRSFALL